MERPGLAAGLHRLRSALRLRQPPRVDAPAGAVQTGNPSVLQHAAWNTKVLGSAFARQLYASRVAGPDFPRQAFPVQAGLGSRICQQRDIEAPWLHYWCGRLGMVPIYHRKVWEDCYVAQAMWEGGMLTGRGRALGFAVGREMLPALLAGQGAEVVATDLGAEDPRARVWSDTSQHATRVDELYWSHLVDREGFDARVRFRPVDMTAIPEDLLGGGFDMVWSVCSFEHLGSIEAGLEFVLRSMQCLRPGGLAVHTTEYNLDNDGPTLRSGPTVLYQRRHIEQLAERLAAAGHEMMAMDFSPGSGVLDGFIDLPPFSQTDASLPVADTPHLRLSLDGFVATSVGMIIRAKR